MATEAAVTPVTLYLSAACKKGNKIHISELTAIICRKKQKETKEGKLNNPAKENTLLLIP